MTLWTIADTGDRRRVRRETEIEFSERRLIPLITDANYYFLHLERIKKKILSYLAAKQSNSRTMTITRCMGMSNSHSYKQVTNLLFSSESLLSDFKFSFFKKNVLPTLLSCSLSSTYTITSARNISTCTFGLLDYFYLILVFTPQHLCDSWSCFSVKYKRLNWWFPTF